MSIPDKLIKRLDSMKDEKPQIFLDYDGTLVPIRMNPEECYADGSLRTLLDSISRRYEMYIVTGRSMEDITEFVGSDYNIIALHGAVRRVDGKILENVSEMPRYRELCDSVYSRKDEMESEFQGLRIYNKGGNLLFHTGLMDSEDARSRLERNVERLSRETGMELYRGKMIVELRIPGINKGSAIRSVANGSGKAIIAGDDVTDEEAFRENPYALRIKVGNGETLADFSVEDYRDMREVLGIL